jgi:hypothetical protein
MNVVAIWTASLLIIALALASCASTPGNCPPGHLVCVQ